MPNIHIQLEQKEKLMLARAKREMGSNSWREFIFELLEQNKRRAAAE